MIPSTTGRPTALPPDTTPEADRRRVRLLAPDSDSERGIISDADRRSRLVKYPFLALQVVLFVGLLVVGFGPLLWLLKAAISSTQDTLRHPMEFFPSGVISWGNLGYAWTQARIGLYLGNTAIIAAGSLVVNLVVSVSAAFVLSVLRPRWGPILSGAILATLFIPSIISLVPLYLTILNLPVTGGSLLNTYWAVWLPSGASAFNVLIIKRFFDRLSRDLFEAARLDGAGPIQILLRIVLPLSRPMLGVVALLTVIASWTEFLWPLLVLQDPNMQPISVALTKFATNAEVSIQMAGLFLALLVPVVLFLVFQRQFLRGVGMSGSVKG